MSSEGGIFLIRDGELVVLQQQPYEKEDLLQYALARFPAVLAGSTTTGASGGQLLLIRREMGVPKGEGAGATRSLDNLFVDSEGVPVIVEVKRSSDTRIRREVIGQMLDYAANGIRYWPVADLRAAFEATAQKDGTSGEQRLQQAFEGVDPEDFWRRIQANLTAGHIRMVFVADSLPTELVRIIEFLNEQMNPAEVLGVEVPQFVGSDHQVLVPRLVGRTAAAQEIKHPSGPAWNEEAFVTTAREGLGDAQAEAFERLFAHVKSAGGGFRWGRGASPGVSGWYTIAGVSMPVWSASAGTISTPPRAYIYFYLPELRRLVSQEQFEEFVQIWSNVPAFQSRLDDARKAGFVAKYPQVWLSDLLAIPGQVDRLLAAQDRLLGRTPAESRV